MSTTMKNVVVAGIVALVVAIGVLLGARVLSPVDNSGVSPVAVMSPDGSVIGTTAPIHASSGPPVPACATTNTVLTCEGTGVPFAWHFPIGGGDSGVANEAFGTIVAGTYDSGLAVLATATLTPNQTGKVAYTASLYLQDGGVGCDSGIVFSNSEGLFVTYGLHGSDAAASTPLSVGPEACAQFIGAGFSASESTAGGVSGLIADGGTSYDFFIVENAPGAISDASPGGLWVHEYP